MKPPGQSAFTLSELLVVILILGVLVALALPAFTDTVCGGSGMTQSLSNQKQLHIATQQMALDGESVGNTNLGWPGDTGDTFSRWAAKLTTGGYLTTNDLCKLLSAPGKHVAPGKIPSMAESAQLVYAVGAESPGDAVFLSTANFKVSAAGGEPPTENARPYGNKGFVVFRKAGDGSILLARQAGQTNLVGSYVPLCRP